LNHSHSAASLPPLSEVVARFQRGDYPWLVSLTPRCLRGSSLNGDPQAIVIIAVACATVGDDENAEILFEALAGAQPENAAYRMNLAVIRMKTGKVAEARELLEQCLRERGNDPEVLFNLGLACFALGDFHAAKAALAPVLEADPGHEMARLYLARSVGEIGDIRASEMLAKASAFRSIQGLHERTELARLYTMTDQPDQAELVLRDLVKSYPQEWNARINLAGILERANRLDDAQRELDQISDDDIRSSAGFLLTQAKLFAGRKNYQQALDQFDRAMDAARREFSGPALLRISSDIEFGRGHALDKLKRFEEAHSSLLRANTLIRDHFRHFNPARTDEGHRIGGLSDVRELDRPVLAAFDEVHLAESDIPVFLVGFPRSGTTLLDQILDAHPGLQVLEEKPAIDTVAGAVEALPGGYPLALGSLTLADAAKLRGIYWQTVSRYLPRQAGTRLVDKYPLNLARIHLIMRLFPKAKWIFAIRHPCDVVLSCFMQNFRFTESTHGFWSIDQTASIYEQVMELWLTQRERLQPDCLDLRYEDLITDFEPNARRLIDFLGLPWDESVLSYNEHAKTRRISTPSYNQVIEPIYKTAAGRWRHYERRFGNALPMLKPFIERLGYSE